MTFQEKFFLYYILLTNQISLSVCFYFLRYYTIYILWLFISHFASSEILKLTLAPLSSCFPTLPKIGCELYFSGLLQKMLFTRKWGGGMESFRLGTISSIVICWSWLFFPVWQFSLLSLLPSFFWVYHPPKGKMWQVSCCHRFVKDSI